MKKKMLLTFLALTLIGCGQNENKSDSAKQQQENTKNSSTIVNPALKRGGTLNLVTTGKFEGKFNPTLSTSSYDSSVLGYIFEGLLTYDSKFIFEPSQMTEDYSYDSDKKQYTFHIKKGIKFSDGKELTSEDIKFSYSVVARPEYTGRGAFLSTSIKGFDDVAAGKTRYLSGIETPDKYTIIFNMKENNARSLNSFVMEIMPKHYYEYKNKEDYKTSFLAKNEKPIGSGPYKLTEYKPGEYVILDRVSTYHGGDSPAKKLVIKYTPEESLSPALATGELDLGPLGGRKSKEKQIASKNNLVKFQENAPGGYSYMGFNLKKPMFKDKNLRHALAYGLNRELYAKKVLEGYASVVNQPLVPQHWANNKDVNQYEYNPEKAKSILEDDGWKVGDDGFRYKDGKKLAFTLKTAASSGNSPSGKTFLALIKNNWKEIGVDVDIQLVDFNAMIKDIFDENPKFDLVMLGWTTIADPDVSDVFVTNSPNNYVSYSNKIVDELAKKGLTTMEQEKRIPIYNEIMKEINEDLPYLFLVSSKGVTGINKRIHGLDIPNDINLLKASTTNKLEIDSK